MVSLFGTSWQVALILYRDNNNQNFDYNVSLKRPPQPASSSFPIYVRQGNLPFLHLPPIPPPRPSTRLVVTLMPELYSFASLSRWYFCKCKLVIANNWIRNMLNQGTWVAVTYQINEWMLNISSSSWVAIHSNKATAAGGWRAMRMGAWIGIIVVSFMAEKFKCIFKQNLQWYWILK